MSRHTLTGRQAQQLRARLAPLVASGRAVCSRCGLPIVPGQAWDVGHTTSLALGGDPDDVAPEHARCNRRDGQAIGEQLRRGRRIRLADWLKR